MPVRKSASRPNFGSDLRKVASHEVSAREYEEIPELTDEMFLRGKARAPGRPPAADPRTQVTIRLPASILAEWKASGPGWQTRMADILIKRVPH